MLLGALLELHPNAEDFIKRLNGAGIPGVCVSAAKDIKHSVTGTHIHVTVDGKTEYSVDHNHEHEHPHTHNHDHEHDHKNENDHEHNHSHEHGHDHSHAHTDYHTIWHIIDDLKIPEKVKKDALAVYKLIAEAEAKIHDEPIEHIHFDEVGTMDAVADIVGVCMLINELAPDKILCSPIHVGSGHVRCAHGVLPVPAPATVEILQGVPIYSGSVKGELCTPTGAALLKYFADSFEPLPVMSISKIGYGTGTKDFELANCVRAFLGQCEGKTDTILELVCNIDDMTGEDIAYASRKLFEEGALDTFTTAALMKKGRPGIILSCLCKQADRDKILAAIFKHTSTLGVREHISKRYILSREEKTVETDFGEIRQKTSSGYGSEKSKYEHEDLAKIANENNLSISQVLLTLRDET